ncbi:HAMP domain-containing histidine kinase, partial [Patescibacteria group bacterium]
MFSAVGLAATSLAIIAAVAAATIGILVWFGDRRNRSRISFLWVAIFIGVWIATNVLFANNVGIFAYPVALVSYMAAMFTVVQLFAFCLVLVRQQGLESGRLAVVVIGYIIAVISALPGVVGTGVENLSVKTHPVVLACYGIVLLFFIVGSCVTLARGYRRSTGALKQRIKIVLIGIIVAGIIGVCCNLILPFMNVYSLIQLGPAGAVALVIAVAYSIVKYSLFDVRLAIVRTVAYVLSILSLAIIYVLTIYILFGTILGQHSNLFQGLLGSVLAFGLGFLFPRVKRFFDRVTNAIFYRDNYDTGAFFRRINDKLTTTTNLHHLVEDIALEIATTLKAEQAYFFIYNKNGHHLSAGTGRHKVLPVADMNAIRDSIGSSDKAIVTDFLASKNPLKRVLVSHKFAITLPLINQGGLVGLFFLANPLASKYTIKDVRLLESIADELVIAIQNALSVQEIRELNSSLQQRVDNATKELRTSNSQLQRLDKAKDDFISMASHQLRTPLTSVKGYISMVREGDVGKITKEQDQMLGEAFASSERMVHLINDFLNVSRLQTGKFLVDKRPVDLAKVIEQELDSLVTNAKSRNLVFTYTPPKNFPILNLDEDKMRQVIMNFS